MPDLHTFPVVSLRDQASNCFAEQVVEGLGTFLPIVDHGVSVALMDEAERLTATLFKLWYHLLERPYGKPDLLRQRGFSGFGKEQAAALTPGAARAPADAKMFWMIRDEESPENPRDNPYGENVWPSRFLLEFRPTMLALLAEYKRIFFTLLRAIESGCGLRPGKLIGMACGAETILRPIFYPSNERLRRMGIEVPLGAQRSAPHCDINVLTVLRPRLGLRAKINGKWVNLDHFSGDNVLLINIGEMLCQVEGLEDRFTPTIHCVGTPPGENDPEGDGLLAEDRVAIPMFGHFLRSVELRPGLRVGDWFDQRICEITTG